MDVLPGTAASTIVVGQTDASEQTPPMRPVAGSFEKFNSYFAAESTVLLVGSTPKIPRRWFSKITLSKPPLPDERPIVVSIVPHPREIVEEIVRGSAKV
jgi:hypothetical protein